MVLNYCFWKFFFCFRKQNHRIGSFHPSTFLFFWFLGLVKRYCWLLLLKFTCQPINSLILNFILTYLSFIQVWWVTYICLYLIWIPSIYNAIEIVLFLQKFLNMYWLFFNFKNLKIVFYLYHLWREKAYCCTMKSNKCGIVSFFFFFFFWG